MSDGGVTGDLLSVNGPRFDLSGAVFDFSDAVFLDMVLYLQGTDRALSAKLKEIRELEKRKEQLSQKLERLNSALAASSAKDPDDLVYVHGGLENPLDQKDSLYSTRSKDQHDLEKEWKDNKKISYVKVVNWKIPVVEKKSNELLKAEGLYRKKEVEAEIEKVRSQLEQLNSASQIFMIDLQRLLNQRNQAVEMTSNIIAKEERTNRGVIENLK